MEVHKVETLPDKKKFAKNEKRASKHTKLPKESHDNKHNRSTSNNRSGVNKDKYKQSHTSGPIIANNSKLPDAFLDVNYKGKRSMKSINKPEKKAHEAKYQNEASKYPQVQPPKSSHGKSKKHNKENTSHSPRALGDDDEHKVTTDDEYRQSGKGKPKIYAAKLPSAFSNPNIKYKNKYK